MQEFEKLQKRLNSSKLNLLLVAVLTIINIVLIAVNANVSFPFSCYIPQLVTAMGAQLTAEEGETGYLVFAVFVSVIMSLVYALLWLGARKRNGFITAALVLFSLDTALLLYDAISFFEVEFLIDIAFHIWVIIELALGISAAGKLKNIPEPQKETPYIPYTDENGCTYGEMKSQPLDPFCSVPSDSSPIGMPVEKSRLILSAEYNAMHVEVRRSKGLTELIVNGTVYGEQRGIIESDYTVSARVSGVLLSTEFKGVTSTMYLYADGNLLAKKFRMF